MRYGLQCEGAVRVFGAWKTHTVCQLFGNLRLESVGRFPGLFFFLKKVFGPLLGE